ncbi:MAG: DUF1761 domain-containing protein [Bacteroidia bacterium]
MDTSNQKLNFLAIGAASVAGMAIGFLWYGMLFTNQWMAGNNITVDESTNPVKMFKNGVQVDSGSGSEMVWNFIAIVAAAFLMNWLLRKMNVQTFMEGAIAGLVVGAIVTLNIFTSNLFAMTPHSLTLLDGSYCLVLFAAIGAIVGGWQKK